MKGQYTEEFRKELDTEWLDLILKARTLGITKEEIRHFLSEGTQDSKTGTRLRLILNSYGKAPL